MKQKKGRILISFLLTLTMVIGMMSGMSLRVLAETEGDVLIETIADESDWNDFADSVINGATYEDVTVTLTNDITVTTMVGSQEHPFCGKFQGGGHTITFNYTATEENTAPFRYINAAKFYNLKVTGTIETAYKDAAGFAAESSGNSIFDCCWSNIKINSTVSGDGTHGGFVAILSNGEPVFKDCLFDGVISGETTDYCGGFVGWPRTNKVQFRSCLYNSKPGTLTDNSATFSRVYNEDNIKLINCYYVNAYGVEQGTHTDKTGTELRDQLIGDSTGKFWIYSGGKVVPASFKSAAIVTKEPVANELVENDSEQKLVTAGEAEGGEMQYALGTDETTKPDAAEYKADIPARTDAGTYYVWYSVIGDSDNLSVTDLGPVIVTVKKSAADVTAEKSEETLVYDTTSKKPEITVKDGETVLTEGVDYDVTYVGTEGTEYEESANAPSYYGTYKAVIKFKGNYSGEDKEVEFEIVRDLEIIRICGDNRFETSLESAEKLKEKLETEGKLVDGKFENIVIASGLGFADALSGSYLAAKKNAPVILVANGKVMDAAVAYINENLAENGKIYILGGTGAVSATFEELLGANFAERIVRLGGVDRYETNLLILKAAGIEDGEDILVCDGTGFADSISVSGTGKAILLVPKNRLTSGEGYSQEAFLSELGGTHKFYMIGGEGAVSPEVEETLSELGETGRVKGFDRFETSVAIMDKFYENPTSVTLVYAENFPDGISAGPLAYAFNEPVVLASNSNKAKELLNGYIGNKLDDVYLVHVFGGETLISDETIKDVVIAEPEENSNEADKESLNEG